MGSAKFNYDWDAMKNNQPSFWEQLSDGLLGTNYGDSKNQINSLQFQTAYNDYLLNKQYENNMSYLDKQYAYNSQMQDKANAFNQSMFNQSTALQNTAYQRATQDMIAAGINPTIAYASGAKSAGSTSPVSSATASGSAGSSSLGNNPNMNGYIPSSKSGLAYQLGSTTAKAVSDGVKNMFDGLNGNTIRENSKNITKLLGLLL